MKKRILAALALVALGSSVAVAGMTAGTGIVGSNHDMIKYVGTSADVQQRVCAFCHTPHHAATTGNDYLPLWSHNITQTNFTPYQSLTLNAAIDPATFLQGPSKLCMSCHDGSIAVDQHYGSATGNVTLSGDNYSQFAIGQGGDLSNDHPIGFDYTAVANGLAGVPGAGGLSGNVDNYINQADANLKYATAVDPNTGVVTATTTVTVAERLYGGTIMTCATCHDVHNRKTVAPVAGANYFLLGGQTGSAICITCHIK